MFSGLSGWAKGLIGTAIAALLGVIFAVPDDWQGWGWPFLASLAPGARSLLTTVAFHPATHLIVAFAAGFAVAIGCVKLKGARDANSSAARSNKSALLYNYCDDIINVLDDMRLIGQRTSWDSQPNLDQLSHIKALYLSFDKLNFPRPPHIPATCREGVEETLPYFRSLKPLLDRELLEEAITAGNSNLKLLAERSR